MWKKSSKFQKILPLCCYLIVMLPLQVWGQISGIGGFFSAGSHDAEILTREYFKSLPSGFGAGINSGWVNSAQPHKTGGFDFQIRGALAIVPSSDESFDLNGLNLQRVRPSDPNQTITPTISGVDRVGPEVILEDNGEELGRSNLPRGIGFAYVPAPVIQASLGILEDTDIMVRFVPRINLRDFGHFNQLGVGGKHSINNLVPGILPIDLSVMAGYNRIHLNAGLDITPPEGAVPDPGYTGSYDNQEVNIDFDTFTVKLLAGKSIPLITVYGGFGYEFTVMKVDVTGDYPVIASGPAGVVFTETITDPFSFSQNGENTLSALAGMKVKVGLLHVFADYTVANYPVANAGIAISFR